MLETYDGSGAFEAWNGWFGNRWTRRKRHEVRSPDVQAGLGDNALVRLSFQDVLQRVHLRETGLDSRVPSDPRQLNERLLCVLTACHEVETARRRLLGALNAQQNLDEMAHLLKARAGAGLCMPAEPRRLMVMRADIGRSVEMATAMWDMASRHFTRVTRLLPVQLEGNMGGRTRMAQDELEQLERQAVRLGEGDRFARAREAYRLAVMDWGLAQARWTRALDARETAETRFRDGRRGALAFAEAVVNQHWQGNSLASREAHLSVKRHALYAIALLLPRHLGL